MAVQSHFLHFALFLYIAHGLIQQNVLIPLFACNPPRNRWLVHFCTSTPKYLFGFLIRHITDQERSFGMDLNYTGHIRSYPYARIYWTDQAGHWRYSLTTYHAGILTAFLAIILAYGLGRLHFLAHFLMHFYLYRFASTKTIFDDQVTVLAANTNSPSGLLLSLVHLFSRRPLLALRSRDFLVTFSLGVVFFALQIYSIAWPGLILKSDPVPYSPGTCGAARTIEGKWWDFTRSRYERAIDRYKDCIDTGDKMVCSGPANQMFSWKVGESEAGHCWFGPEFCVRDSKTLAQEAIITPENLGALRESPLSLTLSLECSHLNNTMFMKRRNDYTWYFVGTTGTDSGATFIIHDSWKYQLGTNYKFLFLSDGFQWQAPDFLQKTSTLPYLLDDTIGPSSIILLVNQLYGVNSHYRNQDPFFLTEDHPNSLGEYASALGATTLICRDRIQITLNSQKSPYGNFSQTGRAEDVLRLWREYRATKPLTKEWIDLAYDAQTMVAIPLLPSITMAALMGLEGGNAIAAQSSVQAPGVQTLPPEKVNTRREVLRWFATVLLDLYYAPQMLTSGTDNDNGAGIIPWSC